MFRKLLIVALSFSSILNVIVAQDADRFHDVQVGLEGLRRAGGDPSVLAQLMMDMQDPEMMAEAKKLMDDPNFKAEMKKLQDSKEFKQSVKATTEMLKDPSQQAAMEAKLEHMVKVGNEQLKNTADATLDGTMEAMLNNPEVMKSMANMVKDPNFMNQFGEMMKDPSFRAYVDSMQESMKDPSKKAKFEQAAAGLKAAM